MTRFARAGSANKRKPNEASSWQELKKKSGQNEEQPWQRQQQQSTSKSSSSPQSFKHTLNKSETKKSSLHGTNAKSKPLKKMKMGKGKTAKANFVKTQTGSPTAMPSNSEQFASVGESSKSLIEELEEMDRQQVAEIRKLGNTQKLQKESERNQRSKGIKDQAEDTRKMDKKEKRSEERRLKRQKMKANKMVS